jgi:hypothetical protein
MEIPAQTLISIQSRYPEARSAYKTYEPVDEKKGGLNKAGESQQANTENQDEQKSPVATKPVSQLTSEEQRQVAELARRDREVRAHEAAHKSAAGQYARGGASFEYQRGPDGKRYAIGGEVSIDVSRPEDPREALEKALMVQRAALAPAQPSNQDRAIAAQATQIAAQARVELQQQKIDDPEKENQQGQATDITSEYVQNGPTATQEPVNLLNLIA